MNMEKRHFSLGIIVVTPAAQAALSQVDIMSAIRRHAGGDWGLVCEDDRQANERSLREGHRILSAYQSQGGEKFWIITEADRQVTTILLPSDY